MTIKKKLFSGLGATIFVSCAISGISWLSLNKLNSSIQKMAKVNARKLYLAGDIVNTSSDVIAEERGILLRTYMNDPATVQKYTGEFSESVRMMKQDLEVFLPLVELPQVRLMLNEMIDLHGKLIHSHEAFYKLVQSHDLQGASEVLKVEIMPPAVRISAIADSLITEQNTLFSGVAEECLSTVTRTIWFDLTLLLLAFAVGGVVAFVVSAINRSLANASSQLSLNASEVRTAAEQVSAASRTLAEGSTEQAASLEETSASTQEINAMSNRSGNNAREATTLALNSAQRFSSANDRLQEMVKAMDQITESSGQISKIIKVIDEIAFQTNILALNAAVEAARAGEAGMGFAVVADEVRSLAKRCAEAAGNTSQLIQDSIVRAGEGKSRVSDVALALERLTADSGQMRMLVESIERGCREQELGVGQVAKAMSQMEQVTQGNAAAAEETSAAATELTAQSESLRGVVRELAAMIGA